MRYIAVVSLLVATMSAQNTPSTNKGRHLDIPAISREANGSIVSIVMSDKKRHPIAQGSGFLISKDGQVVTNYHVIKNGSFAVVKLPNGTFFAVDGVLASDKSRDVAIIKMHGNDFRPLTLGDSDRLQVGEEVVAIGNPLSLESTVSNGIVSAIRSVEDEGGKFVQITAPISPGSSGGPLFNMAGEVVGITTSHIRGGENLNFAIPINAVKPMLRATFSTVSALPDEVDETENHENSPSPKVGQQKITFTVNKGTSVSDGDYPAYMYQIQVAETSAPVYVYCHQTASDCFALKPGTTYKAQVMDVHDPNAYEQGAPCMRIFGIFNGIPMSTVYVIVVKLP